MNLLRRSRRSLSAAPNWALLLTLTGCNAFLDNGNSPSVGSGSSSMTESGSSSGESATSGATGGMSGNGMTGGATTGDSTTAGDSAATSDSATAGDSATASGDAGMVDDGDAFSDMVNGYLDGSPIDALDASDFDVMDGAVNHGSDAAETGDASPCGNSSIPTHVVLFGGSDGATWYNDTWVWDGASWSQSTSSVLTPPARWQHAMAPLCGKAVMVGGSSANPNPSSYLDDQWGWDGSNWTSVNPSPLPALIDSPLAPLNGTLVLFGGYESGAAIDETWVFNGSSWSMAPIGPYAQGPEPRAQAALFSVGGYVVLFGGTDGCNVFNDTWTWNGSTWTERSPQDSPPARYGSIGLGLGDTGMIFGGVDETFANLNETWTWDGTDWKIVTSGTAPPARNTAAAATLGNDAIMFGGDGDNGPLGDTWEWDGANWSNLNVSGPSPRVGSAMTAF